MSTTTETSGEPETNYWHAKHTNLDSEIERLDGLHFGLKEYMDGKLCLAPLGDDFKPKKILELGAGTGTWAIEASQLYPSAEVLATDISLLPDRPLPPNVSYMRLNILDTLPFEPGSFDLIHARFTFVHLPSPFAALARVSALLKPGGWLLIEDIAVNADVRNADAVPGVRAAYVALVKTWEQAGQEPRYAARLADTLRESNGFDVVDVRHIPLPIHPLSQDPKIHGLGQTIRTSWNRSFSYDPSPALVAAGYTPEMRVKRKEEVESGDAVEWGYDTDVFIVGARKV